MEEERSADACEAITRYRGNGLHVDLSQVDSLKVSIHSLGLHFEYLTAQARQ